MRILPGDIYENLAMALQTLRANKLRSFLTVIGVMIGVITVMLIASIISGIDEQVKKEIESFGTRSIFILKYEPGIHVGRRSREERMRKELTYDDAMAIAQLPAVELAVPFLDITNNFFGRKLKVSTPGKTSEAVRLEGTLPDYIRAGTDVVSEGRFFTQYENDTNQRVCVVRNRVAEDFFPGLTAVGQSIDIGG
ncbi:MAG: ABC transporter permease, partial [Pyrinomonadaceae bacterium]